MGVEICGDYSPFLFSPAPPVFCRTYTCGTVGTGEDRKGGKKAGGRLFFNKANPPKDEGRKTFCSGGFMQMSQSAARNVGQGFSPAFCSGAIYRTIINYI